VQVKDLMQTEVYTVNPNDPVDRVFFLIHYEKIRHIPVVESGRVVGIVSDRDLYKTLGPRSQKGAVAKGGDGTALYVIPRKVRHIMRRGVITIEPDDSAARAAAMMASRKIGALPVVSQEKLVGIITSTDLLKAFSLIST
jgi:acetoin utilization protein AcuB